LLKLNNALWRWVKMKKEDWGKVFKKREGNPFENCPLGIWHSRYAYFCPDCLKPVELCVCFLKKSTKND
jgi:hypothetical protein